MVFVACALLARRSSGAESGTQTLAGTRSITGASPSALSVKGGCLAAACSTAGAGFCLRAAESTTLSLTLDRLSAPKGEAHAEIVVMMPGENLHVPLVTLEHVEQPAAGDPVDRRSSPVEGSEISYTTGPKHRASAADARELAARMAEGAITPARRTY